MKISIVTVSFNQHAYLRAAIESILRQGYPELEYIVVDPGSTDGSRDLIQSYSGQIAHIVFEPDRGAADGLNKGFSLATGEVFGFLNADDLLMPGSLQRIADVFRERPECDMAFGNGHIIDREGRTLKHVKARGFTVQRHFHSGSHWLQQSTFLRREAFVRSGGFNPENRTSWDGELFVTMAKQGARIVYVDADLSAFRIHEASISGSGRLQQAYLEDNRRIFQTVAGRNWGVADDLWKFLYRAEGLLLRGISRVQRLAKRDFA
jgi:glycosyltransferase involved in cell wall biosynthesis